MNLPESGISLSSGRVNAAETREISSSVSLGYAGGGVLEDLLLTGGHEREDAQHGIADLIGLQGSTQVP